MNKYELILFIYILLVYIRFFFLNEILVVGI